MKKHFQMVFHWKENPLLAILVLAVGGKVAFDYCKPTDYLFFLGSAFVLLTGILWLIPRVVPHRWVWLRTATAYSFYFWMGLGISWWQFHSLSLPTHSAFRVVIQENFGETSPGKVRCVGRVSEVRTPAAWSPASGNVLLMMDAAGQNLKNGTVLLVASPLKEFETPTIPGQFDSKRYYKIQGIDYQVFLKNEKYKRLATSEPTWYKLASQNARGWMEATIYHNLPDEQDAHMLSALLLGIRRKIDPDLKAAYSSAGVTHILAVSGMHVGLINFVLVFLLGWMKRFRYGQVAFSATVIGLLWFYGFITGLSPSVLRAVTIFTVFQVGDVFKKPPLPINSLCAATLGLMFYDVNIIYDVGYQLSFTAVYGIISFLEPIESLWRPKRSWIRFMWSHMGIPVSIAATLGTFPVILFYFHQFPTYFLFANALAVPWSSLLIYGGIGLIATSFVSVVSGFLGMLLHYGILVLNEYVLFVSKLPWSTVSDIYITLPEVLALVATLVFLQMFFHTRRILILKYSLLGCIGVVSMHLVLNILYWQRTPTPIAIRTNREWLLGNLNGRFATLTRFGMEQPAVVSPFEAKAMKEGFYCVQVDESFCEGRLLSTNPTKPDQFSALFQAEGKTLLMLGNYLKIKEKPSAKVEIDYLILNQAGFKTLDNALLLFQPKEVWVDWYPSRERQWAQRPDKPAVTIRNFRSVRFYTL